MRALLIEDDTAMARTVDLMLRGDGFEVSETDSGEEGLDLGTFYVFDIIILDLNLPDMHGYDVLKKLSAATIDTPILILSARYQSSQNGTGHCRERIHFSGNSRKKSPNSLKT